MVAHLKKSQHDDKIDFRLDSVFEVKNPLKAYFKK